MSTVRKKCKKKKSLIEVIEKGLSQKVLRARKQHRRERLVQKWSSVMRNVHEKLS